MSDDPIAALRDRARSDVQRVIFPEALEENVLRAARQVLDLGVARPVLLGPQQEVGDAAREFGVNLSGIDVIDAGNVDLVERLVQDICAIRPEISVKAAQRKLRSPLNMAAALLTVGTVDAMVAGLVHTTEDVILASMTFVGLDVGISTPSSLFIMRVPGFDAEQGELIAFADCGVVVSPDSNDLADIAIATSKTVRALFGWEPRVALLSYSTKGSGYDESVDKVVEALSIVQEREPSLQIDGELQVDAAIDPGVAARKVPGGSPVAGRANILVFPDLNSGNIAYKCVQRFAHADAYGPFLQGFAKTVSDLSRGSTVADIVGVTTMACVRAQADG